MCYPMNHLGTKLVTMDVPLLKSEGQVKGSGASFGKITFSPDGKLVAIGDASGRLTIRCTWTMWGLLRTYELGSKIRDICWHPVQSDTLFIGCGLGNFYCLTMEEEGEKVIRREVPSFIHTIALNDNRNQLVIGYSNNTCISVVLLDDPCSDIQKPLILLKTLKRPNPENIPHRIFYVFNGTVLIAYFSTLGFFAYRGFHPYDKLFEIEAKNWMCCSLSLSKLTLAVTNLTDGIDYYSITQQHYAHSIGYDATKGSTTIRYTEIVFLDNMTVAAAHVSGSLVVASWDPTLKPSINVLHKNDGTLSLSQVLAYKLINEWLTILFGNGEEAQTDIMIATFKFPTYTAERENEVVIVAHVALPMNAYNEAWLADQTCLDGTIIVRPMMQSYDFNHDTQIFQFMNYIQPSFFAPP
ncbi:uncharacterized protein LACBIDRAFT_333026 [Laccaria bicolor S238N-H82]|uniref:Predicted protein n=1 Tax=Laccaria bicolor (strain S238N-H82 / ATCC MYA-4686) TaxID=486041 RepID=B0DUL6_LACBS|nr:uncharacterized protein LACBIDRAFT_333026 [Laccaria bicolor S238N-H82]EDR01765.1 predicted protein [Laccaria bicolor S238N-H82]|eukprot:XP_001887578.1 predicted protein [Laccaria bicolor S238N-H82]